jgi:hypothetical protein
MADRMLKEFVVKGDAAIMKAEASTCSRSRTASAKANTTSVTATLASTPAMGNRVATKVRR